MNRDRYYEMVSFVLQKKKPMQDIFVFLFLNDYLLILPYVRAHRQCLYTQCVLPPCLLCLDLVSGRPPSLFPHFLSVRAQRAKESFPLSLRSAGPDGAGTPLTATFLRLGPERHSRIVVSIVSIVRGFVVGDAKLGKGEINIVMDD